MFLAVNCCSAPVALVLYNFGCLIALLGFCRRRVQRDRPFSARSHCVILSTPQSLTSHRADTFCLPLSFVSIGWSSAYCHHKVLLYLRSVRTQALSQNAQQAFHGPAQGEEQSPPFRLQLRLSDIGCPRCFSACSPGPRHFHGTARVRQELSIFSHDPHTLAMPRCSWYLCCCCWICWIPLAPSPAVPPRRLLATPGSAETPGGAEECMNTSAERQDAGSSTAQPNIIYKYTQMERSTDRWRITTRSVSSESLYCDKQQQTNNKQTKHC